VRGAKFVCKNGIVGALEQFYGISMHAEEVGHSCPSRASASSEAVALACDLVRKFPECFWFWHPEARVRSADDIRLVIQHLREYGDKQAWAAARDLKQCL